MHSGNDLHYIDCTEEASCLHHVLACISCDRSMTIAVADEWSLHQIAELLHEQLCMGFCNKCMAVYPANMLCFSFNGSIRALQVLQQMRDAAVESSSGSYLHQAGRAGCDVA